MVRGSIIMKGYFKDEDVMRKVFEGGWFYIGDFGVIYLDGYMEVKDWLKDIIILGGENISLIEIELVLFWYLGVLEVVVVVWFDL